MGSIAFKAGDWDRREVSSFCVAEESGERVYAAGQAQVGVKSGKVYKAGVKRTPGVSNLGRVAFKSLFDSVDLDRLEITVPLKFDFLGRDIEKRR